MKTMKNQLNIPELPSGIHNLEVFRSGQFKANAVFFGKLIPYLELPDHIRHYFQVDMLRNKKDVAVLRDLLSLHKITVYDADRLEEAFVSCKYGNYDTVPDMNANQVLTPDAPCCGREQFCPGFGKVCKVPGGYKISPSEYVVIRLVSQGYEDKEIAKQLGVSIHTVRSFLGRIREKLEVKNRVQIALWAQNHNI